MRLGKDHKNDTDEALLLAFRTTGDNRWLGILLERYTLLLLGVAMKYLKDRDEAQDAVQQVFLKAVAHLSGDTVRNVGGWLYVLTRNHCLQVLRDKKHMVSEDLAEKLREMPSDKEAMLQHDYTLEQMEAALETLSHEQKNCIILFYLKKLSYQQIMERTGYTFAQVKSFIQNGKRNLKIMLSENPDREIS